MKKVRETITGMVFEDYQAGDIPQLERITSVFDKITHKNVPTAGFLLEDGFATYKIREPYLRSITAGTPYANFEVEHIPMELGQPTEPFKSTIRLLKSQKQVSDKMMNGNQVFLNIPTATGKTIIAVDFIAKLQVKTIVICFKKKILNQWYDTFRTKTDININRVAIVNSSKHFYDIISGDLDPQDIDIWLATPSVISSFCGDVGWDMLDDLFNFMGIGLKVIDEAHRCFGATIKINSHTSIRTLYLSADFNQANNYTRKMYFDSLREANIIRYDQETMNDLKHITCVHYEFNTHPSDEDIMSVTNYTRKNKYHWDHFEYTKYTMRNGVLLKHIENIISEIIKSEANIKSEDGKPYKILILTNMIDNVDTMYNKLSHKFTSRTVSRYHTKIPKEETSTYLNADIIISTYQAFGEGVDVVTPCIRHVISTSPVDPIMANQSAGRCRPIKDIDSYYWMMVDMGFEFCRNNEARVTRYLANAKIGKVTLIEAG
jgi:superfamily II DNA or RNA helicase